FYSAINTELEQYGEKSKSKSKQPTEDRISFSPLSYLRDKGYEVIDKRSNGGTIWVVGTWEDREDFSGLKKHKFYFRFSKKGSRSTQNRPAWFMLNKSYKGELGEEEEVVNHIVENNVKDNKPQQQPKQEVVEQNHDILLLEIGNPLEQVSEQVAIPKHLLNIEISNTLNGHLSNVTNMLGLYKFSEINDEQLRKLFIKHQETFFSMVINLWVLGVRFSGKLAYLVKLLEEHPTTFMQVDSELVGQLSDYFNVYISEKFKNVGIEKVSDLNMIPAQSIQWLLGRHYNEFKKKMLTSLPIKEFIIPEGKPDNKCENTEDKTIILGNNELTILANFVDVELKIDQFENCQNVIKQLHQKGIYKVKELPHKLDDYHTELKHVGPKAIEKFWDGLVQLINGKEEQIKVKKKSEKSQGEKIIYENEEITFCESIKNQLIENDSSYFKSMPIVLKKFKEVGIYYYKDLPYKITKVQEIKGVGANKVNQLFQILKGVNEKYIEEEKFKEQIKDLDETQLINFFLNNAKEKIDQVVKSQEKQNQLSLHRLSIKIFEERFRGFHSGGSVTLQSMGEKHGITRERIRQISRKTLEKLEALEPRWIDIIIEQVKREQVLINEFFNLNEFIDFIVFVNNK
ncbi:sigma factor-like helix-turn-helix DNA-binding protein, partial [Halalkalibacterium halodurans]|uniref:sigma factor-like helix-turn-helix DNA-binding protein n=1 Tax=Halalkalibacterium halodurans TaxID=86665 RepID=UPI002E1A903A